MTEQVKREIKHSNYTSEIHNFCPQCHFMNEPLSSECIKCGFKFTEHCCISCGIVWYCPKRRYEPHTLWNHKYCPDCSLVKSREENLVDNPTSGFFRVIR